MRVLFVTNGYPTEKYPEYCVFTKDQISSVVDAFSIDSELLFINARERGVFAYVKVIPQIIKASRSADIIHAFHGLTFILVYLLCPGKRIIVSFLNSIENEFSEKPLVSSLLVYITKLMIRDHRVYKIFKSSIPEYCVDRGFHLPNGVNTNFFKPLDKDFAKTELQLDKSKKYILFVSSKNINRPQKRLDRFREVLGLIGCEMPNVEPLLVASESRERLRYHYCASDLHLLTSDFEGSPNSVKEAISCNIPVVSTDVGNVGEMLSGIPLCGVSKTFTARELADLSLAVLNNSTSSPLGLRDYIFEKRLDTKSKTSELYKIYRIALDSSS